MIPELGDLSYEECLKECGLRDQIEVYKILNWDESIDKNMFYHSRKIVELEDMR